MQQAQTLLAQLFNTLTNNHGIKPEQAFGIYDMRDRGVCSQDEFTRILKIFFGEVLNEATDIDFLLKLAQKTADGKIQYREFCKFLSKRLIRTFKHVVAVKKEGEEEDGAETGR